MHCTVFLSQYLDEYDKIINQTIDDDDDNNNKPQTNGDKNEEKKEENEDNINDKFDINRYGHFNSKSFADCFDFRIICYLLSIHNIIENNNIDNNNNNKKKKKKNV